MKLHISTGTIKIYVFMQDNRFFENCVEVSLINFKMHFEVSPYFKNVTKF